jgi:hypothetical protein
MADVAFADANTKPVGRVYWFGSATMTIAHGGADAFGKFYDFFGKGPLADNATDIVIRMRIAAVKRQRKERLDVPGFLFTDFTVTTRGFFRGLSHCFLLSLVWLSVLKRLY